MSPVRSAPTEYTEKTPREEPVPMPVKPTYADLAQTLPRSGIREVMELASTMEDVLHIEVGEPSFNTPPHIIDAAYEQMNKGITKYTPNMGLPALRQAIADRYTHLWSTKVETNQVMATAGAVNAIVTALGAVVQEGDEVLVPDPAWPNYISMILMHRAIPVRYPLQPENGFLPDPLEVAKLVTPRTRVIIMCNPGNPTGAVFPEETVRDMVRLAAERGIWVISDEVYEALLFDGRVHVPAAHFNEAGNVIVATGCSKTYSMTGWRLGFLIGDAKVVQLAGKLNEALVSCAPAPSQAAAIAALTGPQDCVEEMRVAYERRRNLVRDMLVPAGLLPVVPQGAFYAMVDLRSTGMSSSDIVRTLVLQAKVAAAPGWTFGDVAEGQIRISLASSDDVLTEACNRIIAFEKRHRAVVAAD